MFVVPFLQPKPKEIFTSDLMSSPLLLCGRHPESVEGALEPSRYSSPWPTAAPATYIHFRLYMQREGGKRKKKEKEYVSDWRVQSLFRRIRLLSSSTCTFSFLSLSLFFCCRLLLRSITNPSSCIYHLPPFSSRRTCSGRIFFFSKIRVKHPLFFSLLVVNLSICSVSFHLMT